MSAVFDRGDEPSSTDAATAEADGIDVARGLALAAVLAALVSSLQVMYHFIDVVGLPTRFLALVAVSLVAATALARVLRPRVAVLIGTAVLVAGLWWYLTQITTDPQWEALLSDVLSLLSGQSLLMISNVRAWVLGVAPAPVFLTWYFAVRRWYGPAVLVAGGTLGFFVLTGDADAVTTLSGVVAGAGAVGLGDLDRRDEPIARGETILVVAAVMILVPSLVSVVPATAGGVVDVAPGERGADTVEASLLSADETLSVQGSIELSPSVRFTVESEDRSYWRVGGYDRYTGDGWVRTGQSRPYDGGSLGGPPGPSRTVQQVVTVESRSDVMPAAWKPVRVSGESATRVASDGGLTPGDALSPGDSYRVRSRVPDASPRELQSAGRDYPSFGGKNYTQLPAGTPPIVAEKTDALTANADTPYETALTIEQWLENNREYSLDVRRPRGDIAASFLREDGIQAGYCTYFATTMVAMLRSQDVPARFVVGYTPGQRVGDDEWVVRGLNSHAWVEAYFPEHGWIRFDPTPGGPRRSAETDRVQQARSENRTDVDTNESESQPLTPTPEPTPAPLTPDDGGGTPTAAANGSPPESGATGPTPAGAAVTDESLFETDAADAGGGDGGPRLPTQQQAALGLVALVGSVLGIRRSGVARRVYRAAWLRYQPRRDPEADVERAFRRVLYAVEREAVRSRRPGETVRTYFDAVDADERARRVAEIRERARYGESVDRAAADEAVALADDLGRSG